MIETPPLTAAELEKLEALATAATPGPWDHFHHEAIGHKHVQDINAITKDGREQIVAWSGFDSAQAAEKQRKANAAYIAAVNPSMLLRLLDQVRQQEYLMGLAAQQHERDAAQVREAEARWEALKANSEDMNQYYRETLKDEMARLEREPPTAREAWQPIATAPKDKPFIGALIRDGRIWRVHDAQWQKIGFYTLNGGEGLHFLTHWQPLPPPPARREGSE